MGLKKEVLGVLQNAYIRSSWGKHLVKTVLMCEKIKGILWSVKEFYYKGKYEERIAPSNRENNSNTI